jgi:hypothetical protein
VTAAFRVAWFAVLVAVVFTAAYWVGRSVGPVDDLTPEDRDRHSPAEVHP